MRYRVFGVTDSPVEPAELLEYLHAGGFEAATSFRGDDRGWFEAELLLVGEDKPIKIERFLATEDGVRTELHTWIAWLETVATPHQDRLIRHFVGTRQVFTVSMSPTADTEHSRPKFCLTVCRYLARQTEGIYQVDGQGLFTTEGELLLPED
jgi:hypothetical protein